MVFFFPALRSEPAAASVVSAPQKRPRPDELQDADLYAKIEFLADDAVTPEGLGLNVADFIGKDALMEGSWTTAESRASISERRASVSSDDGSVVAPCARLTGPLAGLNTVFVHDEHSEMVMIPSLFQHRRILLVFLRHFGCRFCRQQVAALREHVQPPLRRQGVEVVLVALGAPAQIPKFREETGFDSEIYVDPLPDSPVAYEGFKLCGGRDRLLDAKGDILPHVKTKGAVALSEGFTDGGYGSGESPYTGDIFQVGGMFVLERERCVFAHRSGYAGDVPEISTIIEAATGLRPDGKTSSAAWPGWDAECSTPPPLEADAAPLAAALQRGLHKLAKAPRVVGRG